MQSFFTPSDSRQQEQAFIVFYATYAPKLWGLILKASLPTDQSELIMVNVLVKAWQRTNRQLTIKSHPFTDLLRLAYAEGLPTATLTSILRAS